MFRSTSMGAECATERATVGPLVVGLTGAVVFAILTWVGANVYVPLEPVPVTLQTLFVLLAGAFIGTRYGLASQLLYVTAGAAGLPAFAGGAAGWAILTGPTGGYLLSFLVAPVVVSVVIRRNPGLVGQAAAFTLGTMVIFALGISHLALFYTHDVAAAVQVGLVPFIPGAFLKIAAAISIYGVYGAWRHRRTD